MKNLLIIVLAMLTLAGVAQAATPVSLVNSGGTGWGAVQSGGILYGSANTLRLATTTQGTPGQVLAWLNGIPTFVATSSIQNISLTTSGTSGASTLVGTTLNIPQYSGGGGGAGTNATSTEPMMAKYFVATSTAIASQFPYASSTAISVTGGATFGTSVGTKVGIGTAAPVRSLNVNGKALFGTATEPQPGGSTHQVDIVASGTDSPLMMTGGSGAMEMWNAVAVTRAASFGMAVPGTAITDDLIFSTFNGAGWNENLRIQTSSGNVGIGTPTPNAKLSITQGSSFTNIGELNGSSIYSGIAFGAASAALTVGNYSLLGNGTDTLLNRPTGGILDFRENNTSQMTILPTSGNVGIGNIAPASLLDVGTYNTSFYTVRSGDFVLQPYGHNNGFIHDNSYYNGVAFTRISTGYSSGFQFYNGQVLMNTADTGTGTFVTTVPFKALFSDSGSVGLGGNIDPTVGSYSGSKMVVLGTGNVGIGTSSPTKKLMVDTNTANDGVAVMGSDPRFNINSTSAASTPGYVMTNTSGEIGSLFVGGSASAFPGLVGFYTSGANGFAVLNTPGTQLLRILQNGNVGIGTTTPWRTFDVNGTVGMKGLTGSSGLQVGILCLSATNEVINESVACVASAARYKEQVQNLSVGLDEVLKLKPVSFYWKKDYNGALQNNPNFNGEQISLIADQVQQVDPRLVNVTTATTTFEGKTYAPGTVNGLASTNAWVGLFVQAFHDVVSQMQGILARVSGLEQKVNEQQKAIDSLQAQINALK